MKCPDLSIPITFHSGIGIVVNATCAEYFEPVDPCSGISCQDNASCTTKDSSYECSCNDGYTNSNNSTDSSGKLRLSDINIRIWHFCGDLWRNC